MRLNTLVTQLLLLIIASVHVLTKDSEYKAESCAVLYQKGIDAYLENRFQDCVENLEEALQKYRTYTKSLEICRLKCTEEAELSDPLYPVDVENLNFYEKTIRNTLCVVKCRKSNKEFEDMSSLSPDIDEIFEDKKPYDYLHLCYFQTKKPQKAASAAFTYLVSHPKDDGMVKNLKHYSELPEVDMKKLVNYEAKDYIYFYIHGVDAYEKKDWRGVEENMEESLVSYLQSEEECRAHCEGPFVQEWFPDFIPAIANHFTFCLKCKRKCRVKLNSLNGEYHEDLLPSHYHYLQFAYFKAGKLKAACEAAASYVLFYPDDDTMRSNMEYYKKLPKVEASYFTPRPEAVHYVRRYTYEARLLKFIHTEYNFDNTTSLVKDKFPEDKTSNYVPNIQLIMDEKDLNGTARFVSDGLASQNDCQSLLEMAKFFAEPGDGYKGKMSPHTEMEKFEGLSVGRAALLVYFGYMDSKALELYLQVTEDARQYLVERFQLSKRLYFSYTHLVCRSALANSTVNRTDFSHAIHADNCNLIENGLCEKLPPAYTWRDYSAILYLNHDFKGGEFIFSEDRHGKNIQSSIRPKCGRMVGFSAGPENLHGVRAVKQGTRCAVALWFTFNEKYAETDRSLAHQLIDEDLVEDQDSA